MEQAIAYLYFVLEFYLIAAVAGLESPSQFPDCTWHRLETAVAFGSSMHDVRGNSVNFGDADDAVVLRILGEDDLSHRDIIEGLFSGLRHKRLSGFSCRPSDLRSSLFFSDRSAAGKEQSAEGIDLEAATHDGSACCSFESGGYFILGENLGEESEIRCTVDCGSLGFQSIAAHGHADSLSIVLSVAGLQILVDPGTYAYHTDGEWRSYFRGTTAHNTIAVDGLNQSEIGGHFMWLKHANSECTVWEESAQGQVFRGFHDGYSGLDDPVCHSREIRYTNGKKCFKVQDVLECGSHHKVDQYWHFHPDCKVNVTSPDVIEIRRGCVGINIRSISDQLPEASVFSGSDDPIAGWYSPRFGEKVPTTTVRWRREISNSTIFDTLIEFVLTDTL